MSVTVSLNGSLIGIESTQPAEPIKTHVCSFLLFVLTCATIRPGTSHCRPKQSLVQDSRSYDVLYQVRCSSFAVFVGITNFVST